MKPIMNGSNTIAVALLFTAAVLIFMATTTSAAPHIFSNPGYYSSLSYENQNPEYLLQTLARLRQALLAEEDLENRNLGLWAQQKHDAMQWEAAMNSHTGSGASKKSLRWGMDFGLARGASASDEVNGRIMQGMALSPTGPQEYSKRGLDLGLGRGYSGSQAAKHLMGLAAANFAGGPGRRRRSDENA